MCKEDIRIGRKSVVNRTVRQDISFGSVFNILPANPNRVALIWSSIFAGDPALNWDAMICVARSSLDVDVIGGVNLYQRNGFARIETHGQAILGPISILSGTVQDAVVTITEISLIEPLETV